jgi:Tfp pilus assembly protein PilP
MRQRLQGALVLAVFGLVGAAACGEDAPPPPPAGAAGAKPAAKKPGGPAKGKIPQLQPRQQIEQRVSCPSPEKPTGPSCTPDTPSCEPGLYCLPVGKGNSCEPCPERDSIRHEFKDRDFVADQVRDPFQSFVIVQPGLVEEAQKKIEGPCNRPEQFVASNYSYMDLRLVGIVAQGTQRKVLMMDRGNLGHIIRRGDCVGKEKAVVKDIGTGYVTFVVAPDPEDKNPNKVAEERSVQLHPKGLQVTPESQPEATTPTAPIVAPPGTATSTQNPPIAPPTVPTNPTPGSTE